EAPEEAAYRRDLAESLMLIAEDHAHYGRPGESIAILQQAYSYLVKLVEAEPAKMPYLAGLAKSQHNIGTTYNEMGKRDDGEKWLRDAIASFKKLNLLEPDNTDHLENLATTERKLALSLARMGRMADAGPLFEASTSENERLVADFPLSPDYRMTVAN